MPQSLILAQSLLPHDLLSIKKEWLREMADSRFSVLELQHMVFDKINFERKGFKAESSEVNLSMNVGIEKLPVEGEEELYKVSIEFTADKSEEYIAEVIISGYFAVKGVSDELRDTLLQENAVAILFPYIRSEMSLLTAQPETEVLTLPVMNISEMSRQAHNQVEQK